MKNIVLNITKIFKINLHFNTLEFSVFKIFSLLINVLFNILISSSLKKI
jgi:hypothetical protein